jgi:WD40 repeat protein
METVSESNVNHHHHHHRRRDRPRKVISLLVTTSHPSTAVTTNTSGGSLTLLCPRSGTVQSSTRIQGGDLHNATNASHSYTTTYSKGQVGVSHISLFPKRADVTSSSASSSSSSLAIAYGSSTDKKDSYGMLVTIRHSILSQPIIHWKCRLPESVMSGGLIVSPVTSQHVFGGGSSGTLYVWDVLNDGKLIRTIPSAHYRAITCMKWSVMDTHYITAPWNALLCTGGADGMVHCFSHIDLVEHQSTSVVGNNNQKVHPIRSWTKHNLAVTCLVPIHDGNRMISSGDDGLIVIMDLCSGTSIATIQLPNAIRALTVDACHGRRLFAGSVTGTIHIIDLDAYAIHSTVQMGATIIQIPNQYHQSTTTTPLSLSMEDQVFGTDTTISNDTGTGTVSHEDRLSTSFQAELRGHDRPITSLAVYDDNGEMNDTTTDECLISGDESGCIRIWDSCRGCCIRVIYPWSNRTATSVDTTTTNATTSSSRNGSQLSTIHPVTAIHIIRDESNPFNILHSSNDNNSINMFGTNTRNIDHRKRTLNFVNMVAPLQKFINENSTSTLIQQQIAVPFIEPRRNLSHSDFWDLSSNEDIIQQVLLQANRKRLRIVHSHRKNDNSNNVVRDVDEPKKDIDVESNDTIVSISVSEGEVERLRRELDEAKQTIVRWELVNNKLLERINTKHE